MSRYLSLVAVLFLASFSFSVAAADTDGDGFSDALENAFKTNPNDAASVPVIQGQPIPFTKLGVNVRINFDQNGGRIKMGGRIPLPPTVTFGGKAVILDVGGVVRDFTLDANGTGVAREDVFTTIPGAEADGRFAAIFNLRTPGALTDDGLDNVESKGKVVNVPVSLYMDGRQFTSTLTGVYDAKPNKKGKVIGEARLFSDSIDTRKPPQLAQPKTTLFEVNPNPAVPGEPVTFRASAETKDTEGIVGSILIFGDGSEPVRSAGFLFANGATQQHTYTRERGFTARLITIGANGLQQSRLFIAVGNKTALNGKSGLGSTLQRTGAQLQFQINTENVENTTKVLTTFTDTLSRGDILAARSLDVHSRETVEGEFPTRNATSSGITVAETTVVDETGAEQATVSKQVTVSDQDVGASDALPAAPVTEINVTKMTGKFLFSKDTPDRVSLKGEITLPTGFQPALAGGNSFVIGMGNVVDSVIVDSKGRPLEPKTGVNGRIKRLKITYPRLPKGQTATVGGEIAKVSVTYSIADLDTLGFDNEGVTASLREDEEDMDEVERYIQVGMVLQGVAFESVITVEYKVKSSSSSDTGTFTTRSAK